jgi:hypothetical protein
VSQVEIGLGAIGQNVEPRHAGRDSSCQGRHSDTGRVFEEPP